MSKKRLGLVAFLALAALGLLLYTDYFGRSHRMAAAALGRVHVGMDIAEAEQALSDAWHHDACSYHGSVQMTHLFFFGSHDPNVAGVVYLRSEAKDDRQVVIFVGTVDNDTLFTLDGCSALDLSVTGGE